MSTARWFGKPILELDAVLKPKPEPGCEVLNPDELRATLEGYRALNEASGGRYLRFLQRATGSQGAIGAGEVKGCTLCDGVEKDKKPLSLLCGTAVPTTDEEQRDLQSRLEEAGCDPRAGHAASPSGSRWGGVG